MPPLHVHRRDDETFYVLAGELTVRVGDRVVSASPGTCVHAPKGVPHTYEVTSAAPARWLVVASPAGFEELVERMGRQPGKELFSDYGIQLLGPPGMLPTALGPHEVALGYRGLDPVVVQEDPDEEIPIAVDIELTGVAGADSSGQRNRSTSLPLCSAMP